MWSRDRLVKPPAATRTPSSRCWSSPCDDASSARCVTPSPASLVELRDAARPDRAWSASRRSSRFGDTTPMVPMLAAAWPSAAQICRVKAATEVLPLVPVTAAIVCGLARIEFAPRPAPARGADWRPSRTARRRQRRRRMLADDRRRRRPRPPASTKRAPSALVPGTARRTGRRGFTARLSDGDAGDRRSRRPARSSAASSAEEVAKLHGVPVCDGSQSAADCKIRIWLMPRCRSA